MAETKVITSRDGQRTVMTSGPHRDVALVQYGIAAVAIVAVIVAAIAFGRANDTVGMSLSGPTQAARPAGMIFQ